MDLAGKTALVTGGAVRIGRAICEALARERCHVFVHYRHSAAEAAALAANLAGQGVRAEPIEGDLDTEDGCEGLVSRVIEKAGALDILVNNASVFHKDTLRTATREKLTREFTVNLLAPLALMRSFAAASPGGRIVNLLDRRVAAHDPGCLPYLLSKKALAELTQSAALELAPGITVNAVAPGAVLPPPGKGAEYVRDLAGRTPLRGSVSPADVARAVVFLLQSDSITGQIIFVDGGQHLLGGDA